MTALVTVRELRIVVLGAAQTKGSAKAFVPAKWAREAVAAGRAPRAIVTNDNPNAKEWEGRIATEAQNVIGDSGLFAGPVAQAIGFHLPRPKSLPRRVVHHVTRPDCDKAARCVLDALTHVAYNDDGQVVELHVSKRFAAEGDGPRAEIIIREAATIDPSNPLPADSLFHGLEQ